MKQPLAVHKLGLKNLKAFRDRRQRVLDAIKHEVKGLDHDINILEAQIARAEREGKDGFDANKYRGDR